MIKASGTSKLLSNLVDADVIEANPGGAPCNVLAMLNKLGKKTAFIGKVGNDQFGTLLRKTLNEVGIDTSNLFTDDEVNTTLAFVHTLEDGDHEFSFYRNPGADMMLTENEISDSIDFADDGKRGKSCVLYKGMRVERSGSACYNKKGALLAMPERREIERIMLDK